MLDSLPIDPGTLPIGPAAAQVEWGTSAEPGGPTALQVFAANGQLIREYQLTGGKLVNAKGWPEEGDWTFAAERATVRPTAPQDEYRTPLPQDYAVLGTPYDEFNHLRGLLQPGDYAPDITLISLDASERTLSEFHGRPILIAFWFYH